MPAGGRIYRDVVSFPSTTAIDLGVVTMDGSSYLHSYGGDTNLFIGVGAGNFTLTDQQNVGIGNISLSSLTSGQRNVAVGERSGRDNTDGNDNTFIGNRAGRLATTSTRNTMVGAGAMSNPTAPGIDNIGVGNSVFNDAAFTGIRNIGIGTTVGLAMTTGTDNIGIGESALIALTTGTQNVMIGTDSGGLLTIESFNTAVGYRAMANAGDTTTSQNTAVGHNAGRYITGSFNVYVGSAAGDDVANTGSNNVGIGDAALTNLTTGTQNVAVGLSAGSGVTTGRAGTFIGDQTGLATTGVGNTFLGHHAGLSNTTGANNVYLGNEAAEDTLITGSTNVVIGRRAGSAFGAMAGALGDFSDTLLIETSSTYALLVGDFTTGVLQVPTLSLSASLGGANGGQILFDDTVAGSTPTPAPSGTQGSLWVSADLPGPVAPTNFPLFTRSTGAVSAIIAPTMPLPYLSGVDMTTPYAASTGDIILIDVGATLTGLGGPAAATMPPIIPGVSGQSVTFCMNSAPGPLGLTLTASGPDLIVAVGGGGGPVAILAGALAGGLTGTESWTFTADGTALVWVLTGYTP